MVHFILTIQLIISLFFTEVFPGKDTPGNWTHFRGSNLNGISEEKGFPVSWDDSTNISWKVKIHGKGWSSPVVYGNQVWCTTAEPDGESMYAICIDNQTGRIIHDIELYRPDTVYGIHAVNSYATPTPCIEDGFVYVHFGRYGTACIGTENGRVVWERTDLQCEHGTGPASSPILYKDLLILHMEGIDVRYIIALDKRTGHTVWKTGRPEEYYETMVPNRKKASTTPIVITFGGRDLLISNGSAVCNAYDIQTGKEVWRLVEGDDTTVPMPVHCQGLIIFYTGFVTLPSGEKYCELIAVDPNGKGDIEKSNVRWRIKSPMLQILTPLARDGILYTVDSKSHLQCLDVMTGKAHWSERLSGKFNSSPIWADGHIYFSSTRGETLVFKEGRQPELVSSNRLEGQIWATPAFSNGAILMRTSEYLYKIK